MPSIKFTAIFELDDVVAVEELKVLEHHADRLLDLEQWPEIKQVHDVKVEEVESKPAGYDTMLWDLLKEHIGHDVQIVSYGSRKNLSSICLECNDCGSVVLDAELYTLVAKEDK